VITTSNTPNLPGWIDLGSPDPEASAAFYRKVFGWTYEMAESEADQVQGNDRAQSHTQGDDRAQAQAQAQAQGQGQGQDQAEGQPEYRLLHTDGKIVGGLGSLQDPDAKPEWIVYMRVADCGAVSESCETLGGAVRVPTMRVGPEGSLAQLTDPTGAEFALWQPGSFTGFGAACENNSLLWIELYTRDPDAAKRFYGELFGWQTDAFAMPEGGTYDMWTMSPGVDTESFGGMMPLTSEMPLAKDMWIPYFMVDDTDATVARAVEAGGTVLMPATDAPPGRLAALTDQFGAHFNLLKPMPM